MGTIAVVIALAANYLDPLPHRRVLRRKLIEAGVRTFKSNPDALRGGGPVYMLLADVEKVLRRWTGGMAHGAASPSPKSSVRAGRAMSNAPATIATK